MEGNLLGLPSKNTDVDIVVLQVPYELTTSYGQGTAQGPAACVAASGQVELFDPIIGEDLPAGYNIYTAPEWSGEGNTLDQQLASISKYLSEWNDGKIFPVILGGEHGILPAVINSLIDHPSLKGDYTKLNVVQIDAHANGTCL